MFSKFCLSVELLHNFTIAVGNQGQFCEPFDPEAFATCALVTEPMLTQETRLIPCHEPVQGRYVTVFLKRRVPLRLCEVEVYGSGTLLVMNCDFFVVGTCALFFNSICRNCPGSARRSTRMFHAIW